MEKLEQNQGSLRVSNSAITLCALVILVGCGTEVPVDTIDPLPPRVLHDAPDWAPDGETIAFNCRGDEIWLLHIESMSQQYLSPGIWPVWSPDGTKIAYVSESTHDICVIEIESGEVSQLTDWGDCYFPSWSPDGNRLAFDTNHNDPTGANAIWIMDANGSNKMDISEHGTGEWRMPDWSPNGTELLHIRYVSGGHPGADIFVMDATGNNANRLTENQQRDRYPHWSPNGLFVAWTRGMSKVMTARVIPSTVSGSWISTGPTNVKSYSMLPLLVDQRGHQMGLR